MAYDINAMRNKGDNSQLSQLKDKSFDEALREFVASCSRWYCTPYNELHRDFERWYRDKGDILAFVLYTGLLELIVGILEGLYDYSYEDKTIFNEEGFPIGLFKETYINYCLYKYIHAKTTTESEYYKMRAEQGFGCTLEEELTRRNSEDPSFEIMGAAYSMGTVAEQLYENTKLWGVDPDSQYSFVTCWKTSVDMPEDLVKDLIMFMTEFRDYIDIADICTMCADFMHTAYTLVTKYDIFADITIDNMHKILMMALLFRCYLDQQVKQEASFQQYQMREKPLITTDANKNVAKPALNSLGKLNKIFDELIKHSADFGGEAIPETKLPDGLIVSKFKDAAYTAIDSPYGVYLRWQEAIYTAVALNLGHTMSKTQKLCLVVPVLQKYLYDRLLNCHDGEELKTTLDMMIALATYQFVYLRLIDPKLSSAAQDVLPVISEARENNVKSDALLKQYKDAMIKPMFDIFRIVPRGALVNKDMYKAICTFLKELWTSMFEPAPRNKAAFDFDNIELLYSKLNAELKACVIQLEPEPLGALVEYVSALPS